MEEQEKAQVKENKKRNSSRSGSPSDAVYGFALIGAAVYFIQHATGFWSVVLAILKAIVWPALVIYKLLEFLKM